MNGDGRMTALGGIAYFAEYLREGGFLQALLRGAPLRYTSRNAPDPSDVMGSLLMSVLAGLRRDAVCPELLGFGRIVSEDSVRNGLKQVAERPLEWDAWLRGLEERVALQLLCAPYVADLDNTVK